MTKEPSPRTHLTRRALIGGATGVVVAGAAALAVDQRVLPGRSTMFRLLGLDGAPGVVPRTATGLMLSGSFVSKTRLGKRVGWAVSYPPGSKPGDALPVVVVLHAYGGNHLSPFGSHLGLDHFLARAVTAGTKPFAIAAIDGGNTYWHRRASGDDSGSLVTNEFLPLLATHGLDTRRIGLLGWSMGGYGALLVGSELGPSRVAGIAAMSVALWPTVEQAASEAFDGAADFATHDLMTRQKLLDSIPLRIDCGTGDGFVANDRALVASLDPHPAGGFVPGGHNLDFWRRLAPAELAFLAARL
ncbi:MAG: hypothetical protein JWP75_3175 [Frondihabitans sp.]|nr:hypothetical protein [Frondihabitans sp.]